MALLENCRAEIVEFNGLNLVMDFLNEKPANYKNKLYLKDNVEVNDPDESEVKACERVLQKTAIAISRFSKEIKYSQTLVELGGKVNLAFKVQYSQ
jgi:hypothetical protein